jgi:hypothetical protein
MWLTLMTAELSTVNNVKSTLKPAGNGAKIPNATTDPTTRLFNFDAFVGSTCRPHSSCSHLRMRSLLLSLDLLLSPELVSNPSIATGSACLCR